MKRKFWGTKMFPEKRNCFFLFLKQKQFFHWRNNKKATLERNRKIYIPEVIT